MTGIEYKTEYGKDYIMSLIDALTKEGVKNIILTGVSYAPAKTGVVVYENGEYSYYEHEKLPQGCHGTGDLYASVLTGAVCRGRSAKDAARIAADFTFECIKFTKEKYPDHWYGVHFEPLLCKLEEMITK